MGTLETPWGLWVYLNENIYKSIGAPRQYYDANILYQDIIHLKNYFRDNGYFYVEIDTSIIFSNDMSTVDISLVIKENTRSRIDTIKILGLDEIDAGQRTEILEKSVIKQGDPYTKKSIFEEQTRILRALVNAGYPKVFLDSSSIQRYASTNNISLMFKFNTGKQYRFGPVQFDDQSFQIDSTILIRQMDFETGQVYNEDRRVSSEQNLNRLGIFEFASLRPLPVDTTKVQNEIPFLISYSVLEMQEITPEFLVLNENSTLFSTGFGLSYKHRNLFGGAQNFSVSSRVRANEIEKLNLKGAYNNGLVEPTLFGKSEVQSQLVFPYFLNNRTRASVTLSAEAEKQRDYDLTTLRAKIGFSTKLATFTLGTTEFNIERVDPQYKSEKATGIRPDDSTKQFNFIESYTLQRDKTNNFFSPTSGFFHSATIEEAGVINKLAGGFKLPYSEYYKFTVLIKHYFSDEFIQDNVFAFKIKTGFAELYNSQNTTPVPLPRRFFVGGSGSVRGWRDKQLAAFGDTLKGGNYALEGSFEIRTQLFSSGKIFKVVELPRFWSVLFLDYGNTWYSSSSISVEEVAMAIGFGLRYETFIGPFRFDAAWRLYDPKKPIGQQWLHEQQFLKNSFAVVHIGIGHAF